jgi:hypothetical protein
MRIADLLSPGGIVDRLLASTPERAVRELLGRAAHPSPFKAAASSRIPVDRLTLACGRGIILLRMAAPEAPRPYILLGRAPLGLAFPSSDDLVQVVIAFLGTARPAREERAVLTRLAASLSLRESAEALRSCQIPEHFQEALRAMDEGFSAATAEANL